jgi:hypothetical protein
MSTNESDGSDEIEPTRRSDAVDRTGGQFEIPKSVVEARLDASDHGLIPDQCRAPASDALFDALIDAFSTVSPAAPAGHARAAEEAADVLRELRDRGRRLYVVRRTR